MKRTVKKWSPESTEALCGCFVCTDWSIFEHTCTDLDACTDSVTAYVSFHVESHIPTGLVCVYANNKLWFTKEVKNKLMANDAAFRSGDCVDFWRAKYDTRRAIARAKLEYKDKLEGQFASNNTHTVWQGLQTITQYLAKSVTTSSNQMLPNQLNEFYAHFDRQYSAAVEPLHLHPPSSLTPASIAGLPSTRPACAASSLYPPPPPPPPDLPLVISCHFQPLPPPPPPPDLPLVISCHLQPLPPPPPPDLPLVISRHLQPLAPPPPPTTGPASGHQLSPPAPTPPPPTTGPASGHQLSPPASTPPPPPHRTCLWSSAVTSSLYPPPHRTCLWSCHLQPLPPPPPPPDLPLVISCHLKHLQPDPLLLLVISRLLTPSPDHHLVLTCGLMLCQDHQDHCSSYRRGRSEAFSRARTPEKRQVLTCPLPPWGHVQTSWLQCSLLCSSRWNNATSLDTSRPPP